MKTVLIRRLIVLCLCFSTFKAIILVKNFAKLLWFFAWLTITKLQNLFIKMGSIKRGRLRKGAGIRPGNVCTLKQSKTKQQLNIDILFEIKNKLTANRLNWLGHTLRKGQDDITNQSLKWNPQGNRKVGKPKYTWKRELQNELKREINKTLSEALTIAASKEKLKDLVRGLCFT